MKRLITCVAFIVPEGTLEPHKGLRMRRINWGLEQPTAPHVQYLGASAPTGIMTVLNEGQDDQCLIQVEMFNPWNTDARDKTVFTGNAKKKGTPAGWEYSIRMADEWGITIFTL